MSRFLVYVLVDPRNGDRFYVGQSSIGLARPQQHMKAAALREKTPKADYVRGLIAQGLEPRIEVLQHIDDPDEAVPPLMNCWTGDDVCALDDAEQRWIAHGRAAGWPLTNRTLGGDGLRGLKRTAEHNAKISASHVGNQWTKGIPKTAEHRAKLSAARKAYLSTNPDDPFTVSRSAGRKHSDEAKARMRASKLGKPSPLRGRKLSDEMRAKLSAAHVGKTLSPETREKLRAAFLGDKNPMFGKTKTPETRAKLSAARMGKRATDETRAKMSAALSGARNPAFGKRWTPEQRAKIASAKRINAERRRLLRLRGADE